MPDTQLVEFGSQEQAFMKALLSQDAKIDIAIPDEVGQEAALSNLGMCCNILKRLDSGMDAMKPVVGRILVVIRDNALYKQDGKYEKFSDFLEQHVYVDLRMKRSTVYEAMRIVDKFPALSIQRYKEIGATNLIKASRVTDHTDNAHKKILDKAAEMTGDEFDDWLETQGHVETNGTKGATIKIHTSKAGLKRWMDWIAMDEVKEYFGTDNAAKILDAMMGECATEIGKTAKKSAKAAG